MTARDVPLDVGSAPSIDHAPPAVSWITRTLESAGYETWAVGGSIRDHLLGIATGDWDFATRATPAQVQRTFRRTVPIGVEHGTVGVLSRDGTLYEVTTFRRDIETDGRHAKVMFADRLEEDLARRDFTVNAIAWHPLRHEFADPFDGVGDLRRQVLRTVGEPSERFREDYLRVLRALRFAGRFRLDIDPATWSALREAVPRLGILSPERVREELTKVVEGDPDPARALALWKESGALAEVAPELGALATVPAHLVEGDAWSEAAEAVERIPIVHPWARWTTLTLGVGRATAAVAAEEVARSNSTVGDRPSIAGASVRHLARARALGLRVEGRDAVAALMIRLRFSNAAIDRVAGNALAGEAPPTVQVGPGGLRRWLSVVGGERLPDLLRAWVGRARAAGPDRRAELAQVARALRGQLRAQHPLEVGSLAVDGRDLIRLGIPPGPEFGVILEDLLERVLESPELNQPEKLLELVRSEWREAE